MPDDRLFNALLLVAAIAWAFAAVGCAMVVNAKDAASRLVIVRPLALVMVVACGATAAALAVAIW